MEDRATSPRVLIVESHASYFCSHRKVWAETARERGYDVRVTALKPGGEALVCEDGYPFYEIADQERGRNPIAELRLVWRLYRLFSSVEPDLAHLITLRSLIYGALAARLAGVPAVLNNVTGLGFLFSDDRRTVRLLRESVIQFLRLALTHPNQITTFQNPDDAEIFHSRNVVSEERTVVTPGSGVDPDRFAYEEEPAGEGNLIAMLPTRMLWHKGVGTFVEAAEQLQHSGLSARFVLVGDTDPENPGAVSEEQIKDWESAGIIEWWGPQESDEMPDVLRQAHVVCLPSYYREGIPKVLIEAASCGRPIVTTDVPGCREIVADRENGMLVPTKDGEALAGQIRSLLENQELRREMGREGRRRVEQHFTAQRVADQVVGAYDHLLGRNGA